MLRFKILASVVPLAVAAVFARGELVGGPRPCIEVSGASLQIAALSWQAERHVSFTSDPRRATVRVQITDSAEAADFTVIDDVDTTEAGACQSQCAAATGRDLDRRHRRPIPSSISRRTARPITASSCIRRAFRRAMPPPSSSAPAAVQHRLAAASL